MVDTAPGVQEMASLQEAGFQPQEIEQWKADTTAQLQEAGFATTEVDEYFGIKNPDMANAKAVIDSNTQKNMAIVKPAAETTTAAAPELIQPEKPELKQADSFMEALEAGFDMSVVGLIKGKPDVILPEHAPMFYRIASQVGMMAGDIPAMIAGGIGGAVVGGAIGTGIGGAVGSVAPGIGTLGGGIGGGVIGREIGMGAGAMALPEAIRTVLMEHYEKGDVQSFSDFWERASAVFINSTKAAIIGGATMGVGGAVGQSLAKSTLPAVAKTTAQLTAEITTMTMVGSALEGKIPEPTEFLDAAVLMFGLKGAGMASTKIRSMYSKGNLSPVQVVEHAAKDPKFMQEMAAVNVETPRAPDLGLNPVKPTPPENISTVKPLKELNPNLSPEVNTILGKVTDQPEAKKSKLPSTDQIYTALVDKLDPINQATKILSEAKELPAADNPYVLARTAVDAPAKAKHIFENGTLDYRTLEKNGESLKSILKDVESVETLEAYMISKRVLEKSKQGLTTGFDVAAAEKVVAEHGKKYEAAAKRATDFQNRNLDYVADSGVLSKEQVARMKEANKDYVPFKRIMDVEDPSLGSKIKRQGKAGSLKEFKGSERDIQSPILSIVENTTELVKMAERNRPKQALIKLAEATEGQDLIKEVPARMKPIEVSASEIVSALEAEGANTIKALKKNLQEKGIKVDDETLLKAFEKEHPDNVLRTSQIKDITIFRKQQTDLAPNQFNVYIDGKRKVFETTPDLAEALKRIDGDTTSTNLLFKFMNGITTVKKIGITFTPDFIIRNFFRDTLTASTFSKSRGMNPLEIVQSMGDIIKKNDSYYNWLKSGGANGAFLDMGNRYVTTDIYQLQKQTGFMGSARNVIEKPFEVMRVAAELAEQSVRLTEFKNVRKAGGSLVEGGIASREITVDFQRVGAKVSALNSITAFMNVSIQGLDRTARAFKEDPSAVATKAVAYITVPSVLLWWANHDDPRYQEIPRWEKDLFWIIPTDNWQPATAEEADGLPSYMVRANGDKFEVNKGVIYRLPKPQELGVIFGSLPERTLEAFFSEQPGAFKDFNETMVGLVTPAFVPDAVSPAIEQYFNKSLFTGRDIIPNHLKGVLPEYQFVEYTSETAKALGKMVGTVNRQTDFASPMVLQNYIQSWGGSLGKYAVQVADKALTAAGVAETKNPASGTLADIPFIKSFVVRYPMAGTNSVQMFQDSFKENKQVLDTIRHLAREGDFKNMEKELVLNSNQDNLVKLDGIQEALSNQSNLIRLVNKNPDMSPDEKRQIIDSTYLMMTEVAKQGNNLMQELKKQLGE
jgi:hypothetical protein